MVFKPNNYSISTPWSRKLPFLEYLYAPPITNTTHIKFPQFTQQIKSEISISIYSLIYSIEKKGKINKIISHKSSLLSFNKHGNSNNITN